MTVAKVTEFVLKCDCGKQRTFKGHDVDEIIRAIDASQWRDLPERRALCPTCDAALDDEYLGCEE
jgi:hypothetical protein